jgi:hypothetical protein
MTDVQAKSLPVSPEGEDILGVTRTGSGKILVLSDFRFWRFCIEEGGALKTDWVHLSYHQHESSYVHVWVMRSNLNTCYDRPSDI